MYRKIKDIKDEINIKKKEDNLVSLNIVVPAKEADSAYNMAVSRISQHINIDGFRKGKLQKLL